LFHGVHHDYPRDSKRLVMTPFASIPAAIASFYLFHWVFGAAYGMPVFIGFVSGYVVYDMIHYALHHGSKQFPSLRKYHLRHHYTDHERGFGVTTPFWDYVFHTQFKK
jgi:sterol desaturase/sphingolipid hydroxylase (fatty acid hydroxylase superfamily)